MERLPEFIANHLWLVTLFVSILALLLWHIFAPSLSGLIRVGPAEATRLLNNEKALLLDLRSSADFSAGHILNARHIPAAELAGRLRELQKHRKNPVILCCGRDADGIRAGRLLKAVGCQRIYSLKGGLEAWRGASLPVTRT